MTCRVCGRENAAESKICSHCGAPLVVGTQRVFNCPRCGKLNPVETLQCRGCAFPLELVEQVPERFRTAICPECHTPNLPPTAGSITYCIGCGRRLFGPGIPTGAGLVSLAGPTAGAIGTSQVESTLATWNDRLKLIDRQIAEVTGNPTYKSIHSAASSAQQISSRAQWIARAGRDLKAQRTALGQVIDHARKQWSGLNRVFPSDQTLGEMTHLLIGRPIAISGSHPTVVGRGRSEAPGQARMTADELVALILRSVEQIKITLQEIAADHAANQPDRSGIRVTNAGGNLGRPAGSNLR